MGAKLFSDQIRDAVNASELSRYAICQEIDLPQSSMSRFMNGGGGITTDTLDRLAELLGLAVTTKTKRKRKRRGD
jgi:plasmid maintenance system antidote protein VapI